MKMERRRALVDAVVTDDNALAICLWIDEFYSQQMARTKSDESPLIKSKLCAKMQWEPDLLHNVHSTFKDT